VRQAAVAGKPNIAIQPEQSLRLNSYIKLYLFVRMVIDTRSSY